MSEMEGLSFASVDEALQGQIAGLDIVFNSGDLGSGTQMRLRGTSTISGNQEPLIVVNDNIFEMPDGEDFDFSTANEEKFAQLLTVNPEDIESIEVLKDASASAVWGSRGSNGVIMIKTKRGSRGKTRVTYSYRYSNAWTPKGLNLLNGDDYTMFLKEAHFNPTQSSTASNAEELNYNQAFSEYENYNNNTDWVKAVSKHGHTHDHNISLTGGGEKATFRVSGGYYSQSGQIIKQQLDRFTTRMALDYYVSDRIRVSSDFSLTYTDNDQNYEGLLANAQLIMPNMSIFSQYRDSNGNVIVTDDYYQMLQNASGIFNDNQKNITNPVAVGNLAWKNEKSYRIAPQISLDYQLLGLNHDETQLRYYGMVYMDASTLTNSSYRPSSLSTKGIQDESSNASWTKDQKTLSFNTRHRLTFSPKFNNPDHVTQFLAQFEMSTGNGNSQESSSYAIPSGITSTTTGTYLKSSATGTWQWRSMAMLAQAFYSYKEGRYSATATLRRDGSTKFGANNRWGNFPSLSLRWNIIDEPWMEWAKPYLSMFSLRPGFGLGGHAPGSNATFNSYSTYNSLSYLGMAGFQMDYIRLTDLRRSDKREWNIGSDFGFFSDFLTGAFNFYHNMTRDNIISNYRLPSSTGFSSLKFKNSGTIRNYGWELNMNLNNIKLAKDFSMSMYFNIGNNFNEIIELEEAYLDEKNGDYDAPQNSKYLPRIQIGNPSGAIYGFRYKGVYRYSYKNWEKALSEEEAGRNGTCPIVRDADGNVVYEATGKPKKLVLFYDNEDGTNRYEFKGGDAIYEDINHDGTINQLDIVYLGNSNPAAQGGFGLTFRYKKWSLRTSFTYRWDVDVVNSARMAFENMSSFDNQSYAVNWRWRKEGDITEVPRAIYGSSNTFNYLGSDRYVEDASYIRLSYVQLSYSFEPEWLKKVGLTSLNVYASADNVCFWTKYTGLDPEVACGGGGVATDVSKTPRSRSYTLSLSVGF